MKNSYIEIDAENLYNECKRVADEWHTNNAYEINEYITEISPNFKSWWWCFFNKLLKYHNKGAGISYGEIEKHKGEIHTRTNDWCCRAPWNPYIPYEDTIISIGLQAYSAFNHGNKLITISTDHHDALSRWIDMCNLGSK